MKTYLRNFSGIICIASFCSSTIASPTSNEFVPCKKIAVKELEFCINKQSYPDNDACWLASKKSYDSCIKNVFERHSHEKRDKRIAAEKEAMKAKKQ